MAKKKTAPRKRKSATRKSKSVRARNNSIGPAPVAMEESVEEKKTVKTKKVATTKAKQRPAAAERKKTTRRTAKKKAATSKARAKSTRAASTRKETARKRSAAEIRRGQVADDKAPDETTPHPRVVPVSPTAEVVQSDDAIVIRFPSAASPDAPVPKPPRAPVPKPPTNDEEVPPVVSETAVAGSDEFPLEPPIDWETAREPETVAGDHEAPPPPPVEGDRAPEGQTNGEDAAPTRSKRRRRRRKKDPRLTPDKEASPDERPEVKEDRQRPEPAERAVEEGPAEEKKPSRRRRRRSRRGRKQEVSTDEAGAPEESATEAKARPKEDAKARKTLEPSGQKEMIINVVPHEECRIAILEAGKLQEIYLERASAENFVGKIYKGIVTNVESSIQAAFVDFGQGKNGFLHISDLHPQYFADGEGQTENVGRKMPRRSRPPIQRCLRRKQELLVQIIKEGIGTKGPTLTTYLSIPGRFLVMMPGMRQLGVSRKIEDEDERRKLRGQLQELELPDNIGFIARTAALDRTKRELQSDLNYLSRLWKAVAARIKTEKAPTEIYTESDLVTRTIRDVYASDISQIVIDNAEVAGRANEFLSIFSPRAGDIVSTYTDPEPIFHRYGIEAELERLHSRHVPLKSGGSLVIDQTEALVAIDVNSGRFRAEDDAESTAFKIDLEAAEEIARQLRLRDLGGLVICDFIDVRKESHKREIERCLNRNLKAHKERAKLLRMSEFGIIELTRQRQRASLTRSVYQDCQHCRGTGLVKTAESVALDVMRLIQLAAARDNIQSIEVSVSADVAYLLQNRRRAQLHALEAQKARSISIRTDPRFSLDRLQIRCTDARGRVIPHPPV